MVRRVKHAVFFGKRTKKLSLPRIWDSVHLNGAGTVFELSSPATGQTAGTMTLLRGFSNSEGSGPSGRLAMDARGNLFGSATIGGTGDNGTVFELSPPAAGGTAWSATVLRVFSGADSRVPNGVILTSRGTLVGSTADYGTSSNGRVFELSPSAQGQAAWTLATLHCFTGTDRAEPASDLVAGPNGVLYGTPLSPAAGPAMAWCSASHLPTPTMPTGIQPPCTASRSRMASTPAICKSPPPAACSAPPIAVAKAPMPRNPVTAAAPSTN